MNGDQRRGAGGIHSYTGAMPIKYIGKTVHSHTERITRNSVEIYLFRWARLKPSIITATDANKDPVWLPTSFSGACPACSNVSQATSINSLCCGSMLIASRGAMPKNNGSKRSTCSRNPPQRDALIFSGAIATSRLLVEGNSRIASPPCTSKRQNSSGVAAPGKRHPRPITATGSSSNCGVLFSCDGCNDAPVI